MTRSLKLRTAYGQCSRALHGALGNSMHDGDISFHGECHCFGIKQNPFFFIKNVKLLGADPSLFQNFICTRHVGSAGMLHVATMLPPCVHYHQAHIRLMVLLPVCARCSQRLAIVVRHAGNLAADLTLVPKSIPIQLAHPTFHFCQSLAFCPTPVSHPMFRSTFAAVAVLPRPCL